MATISELVEKYSKVPGDIKVRGCSAQKEEWFAPYFLVDGWWYGVHYTPTTGQDSITYSGHDSSWELWQEPKKTKKIAPYLVKSRDGMISMTAVFYENDDHINSFLNTSFRTPIRRMTELEVEVDSVTPAHK